MVKRGFLRILEPRNAQNELKAEGKTGIELEVMLTDKEGMPAPHAEEIIRKASEDIGCKDELSSAAIELVTEPHPYVLETCLDILERAKQLDGIARDAGMLTLPLDTSLVPYKHGITSSSAVKAVAEVSKKLIGQEGLEIKNKINGTHIHFSQEEGKVIDQMNYLTAADPVTIILTSASPIGGFHNWRIHNYRNVAHREFPYQGQMQHLKRSLEEHEAELRSEFERFKQRAKEKGYTFSELDYYTEYCSILGPVRLSPKNGTVEDRTSGSNPFLYNLIAYLTLLDGGMRRIRSGDIDGVSNPLLRSVLNREDLKGDSARLKRMHDSAARYGFDQTENYEYCMSFIGFAYGGLTDREKGFVDNLIQLTSDGNTAAASIARLAESRTGGRQVHRRIYEDIYVPQREFMIRTLEHLTGEIKEENERRLSAYGRTETQKPGPIAGYGEELVFA